MATSTLPTRDVLRLIKACKQNGVTSFTFGDLVLTLEKENQPLQEIQVPTATIPENIPQNMRDPFSDSEEKLNSENDTLAMMLIENPLEMEALIARGELVDEATEP